MYMIFLRSTIQLKWYLGSSSMASRRQCDRVIPKRCHANLDLE